eukprot:TRINITY_DN2882_c0_g1_i1.p1 TRINITY_DN2882_c0_g1~~TRINITY_DN2882_c0_g1_i1.p1  ORF type:complete len:422 (-),score=46.03 TRINITY_DN2882_c0_g1_i1:246-1511(-)
MFEYLSRLLVLLFWLACFPVFILYKYLIYKLPQIVFSWWRKDKKQKSRVVIVGGGFMGTVVAQELQIHNDIDVTLIDKRGFFEYTPSLLRACVFPSHFSDIQVPHEVYLDKSTIIKDSVTKINNDNVEISSGTVPFDYLVLATGSSYVVPLEGLKNSEHLYLADSGEDLARSYARLKTSKNVLIIGGGITGVELAIEIAEKYPTKKITLVHSGSTILSEIDKTNGPARHAENVLKKFNVDLIVGNRVVTENSQTHEYVTDKQIKIPADVAYLCACAVANTQDFKRSPLADSISKQGISVNENLQVVGFSNIYSGGDVVHPGDSKLAQSAEAQASVIATNIIKSHEQSRLNSKKVNLTVHRNKEYIKVISLGKYDGIIVWKWIYITGVIPALLKEAIEWKTMVRYWSWPIKSKTSTNKKIDV